MRQQHPSTLLRIAPALTALLFACGGDDTAPAGGAPADRPAAAAVENPAVLTGQIVFNGAAPARQPIDMRDEPDCAERFDPEYPHAQPVAVQDGRLQNVFVYVKDGLSGSHPASTERVVIDQRACIYTPRVVGVQTGQEVIFRNSDDLLHNIRASPTVNRLFNITQPRSNMESARTFSSREIMVPIECNVHGWMQAYVGVLDHPYFAVSGQDGSFRIDNLPPGTYTIEAWHERYGTQTQQVTVGPNETSEIDFAYDAGMAGRPVPLGTPVDPHAHVSLARHDHAVTPQR
jgi:plastocyanin